MCFGHAVSNAQEASHQEQDAEIGVIRWILTVPYVVIGLNLILICFFDYAYTQEICHMLLEQVLRLRCCIFNGQTGVPGCCHASAASI